MKKKGKGVQHVGLMVILVKWSLINLVTKGPQRSGLFDRVAILKGFFK